MQKLRNLAGNSGLLALVLMACSILIQALFVKFFSSGAGAGLVGMIGILGHIGAFILALVLCGFVKQANGRLIGSALILMLAIVVQSEFTGTDGGPQPLERMLGIDIGKILYR